jgi:hypothetical protein
MCSSIQVIAKATGGKGKQMKAELEFSESGRILRILCPDNNRIIAEILVHGPLRACAKNAAGNVPIQKGRPNIYRGELYGLTGYEILDKELENIIEKENL